MPNPSPIDAALAHLDQLLEGVPFRVSLYHDVCSLSCLHCGVKGEAYFKERKRQTGASSTGSWLKILRWLSQKDVESVVLTGGEITERDDFHQLVIEAQWAGLKNIVIETNGRRFSDPQYCGLFSPGKRLSYIVALHGSSSSVHDGITGVPGSFDETIAGISNLASMTDSRVDVCVVLSKYNVHDVCDIVNLARGKGVRTLFITLMILRGRGIFENLPSLEAARASIRDLLEEFSGIGEDLLFNNVPLCFLGDCYKNSINYQSMKRKGAACELMFHTCNLNWSFIAEMALPTPLNYPECCAPCFFRDFCPAPSYISLFADPEKYVRPTQLLNTS